MTAERIITRTWWLLTMSLIALTGIGAMLLAYRGLFSALSGSYADGVGSVVVSAAVGAATYLLARHRLDLVGD